MSKKIIIFYFSGTGNTSYVARMFQRKLSTPSQPVRLIKIEDYLHKPFDLGLQGGELIGLGYPIHCFNAPRIVDQFIHSLNIPSAVFFLFMTAADSFALNQAAGVLTRRQLFRKNHRVCHESIVRMPSNIFFQHSRPHRRLILTQAIAKTHQTITDLQTHTTVLFSPNFCLTFLASLLSGIERAGSRLLVKDFRINARCTLCRVCLDGCPTRNITLVKNRIGFRLNCMACLRCIYSCPQHAIKPYLTHFAVVKDWREASVVLDENCIK